MPVEAYEIGVNLVANATRVTGPIGEMIEALERLLSAQREAQQGFNGMVSSLGGARRLAGGMADDMERAARAARDIASASGRFRAPQYTGADEDQPTRSRGASRPSSAPPPAPPPLPDDLGRSSYVSPYSAAATNVPDAPTRLLPAPSPVPLLGYDPRGEITVVRGAPGPMYGSTGPGVMVGAPYGPPPPRAERSPLLLEYQPEPSRALTVIPGQGNSMGNGASFRGSETGYAPDFTMSGGPESVTPERHRSARETTMGVNYGSSDVYGPFPYAGPHAVNPGEVGEGVMAARGALSGVGVPRVGPLAAGMAAYAGIHGAGETLASAFSQTGQYDQTFLGMQGDPLAATNMAAIQASAQQAMRENRYLTPVDAARMAQEAYEVSGGHMEEQAPVTSLINRVDRTFQLLGKSPEEAMRESIAFIRAQDISNRFYDPHTGQFSMERASESTNSALGMVIANRQFMRGQNFQSFARSAGLAAQNMSDEGMLNLAHFIDVNPARAGMQVRSFENLFAGDHTRMTDKDFAYFSDRLHLTDRDGRFIGQEQLTSDPIGWINHYLSPLIATHPELLGHIQRMNVSDLAGEATGAEGNIARQAAAARRTDAMRSVDALSGGQSAQSLAMHAAWERLEFTIGRAAQGPFISSLQSLTNAFNGISDFVGRHPDDVRQFADDISALIHAVGAIAGGIGYVLEHIPGPIRRILESAAAGAATGAIGGSVLPGAGTAAGAIGGAVVGSVFGVAHEGYHQANRISAMQYPQTGGSATQHVGTANISVKLDSREIASAVHDVQFKQDQQEFRATGTEPDPRQSVQLPGRAIGR